MIMMIFIAGVMTGAAGMVLLVAFMMGRDRREAAE